MVFGQRSRTEFGSDYMKFHDFFFLPIEFVDSYSGINLNSYVNAYGILQDQ